MAVRFSTHCTNCRNSLLGSASVAMIQTKITGAQGLRRYSAHQMPRQKRVLATLSSRSGVVDLTTSIAPTHQDRPKVDTFCESEDAKDPAVSGRSRRRRLQQTRSITGTYPEVVL